MSVLFRKPQRISITVNHRLYEQLLESSDLQGRSVSNLAAFLLESALEHNQTRQPAAYPSEGVGVDRQTPFQPSAMLRR
ncbi:MAG: hypothetical protein FJ050_06370 [Cyanobacteria bacterium M_surface_7_m2_040]|nr:hypothetical protein [Cyanobacteria bacterium M_surface_7_m2_040]